MRTARRLQGLPKLNGALETHAATFWGCRIGAGAHRIFIGGPQKHILTQSQGMEGLLRASRRCSRGFRRGPLNRNPCGELIGSIIGTA